MKETKQMKSSRKTKNQITTNDAAPEIKHIDDMDWETSRFGSKCKFLFHPNVDRPTEPNAGLLCYEAGATFVLHRHDFAQIWYVIDGECQYGDTILRAGNIVYHPDPHFEHDMYTENGCTVLFVQYPGPTTGAVPLYDGRMNLQRAETIDELDLEI